MLTFLPLLYDVFNFSIHGVFNVGNVSVDVIGCVGDVLGTTIGQNNVVRSRFNFAYDTIQLECKK